MPTLLLKKGMSERDSWPLRRQHSCVKFPFTVRSQSNVTIHCRTGQSTGQSCCIFLTTVLKQVIFIFHLSFRVAILALSLPLQSKLICRVFYSSFRNFLCFQISVKQKTSVWRLCPWPRWLPTLSHKLFHMMTGTVISIHFHVLQKDFFAGEEQLLSIVDSFMLELSLLLSHWKVSSVHPDYESSLIFISLHCSAPMWLMLAL